MVDNGHTGPEPPWITARFTPRTRRFARGTVVDSFGITLTRRNGRVLVLRTSVPAATLRLWAPDHTAARSSSTQSSSTCDG